MNGAKVPQVRPLSSHLSVITSMQAFLRLRHALRHLCYALNPLAGCTVTDAVSLTIV